MSSLHSDNKPILEASAGPKIFRVTRSNVRLAVSGPGILEPWDGVTWAPAIAFAESSTISSPGTFRLTLDAPGNASIQE